MKARGSFILAAALLAILLHGSAFAGGWGPFFSWGRDDPTAGFPDDVIDYLRDAGVPPDIIEEAQQADLDFQIDHVTFGVLFDSAPSRDKLFNYRLALGFDISTKAEITGVSFPGIGVSLSGLAGELDQNGYGFSMNHTFGFAVVRTELIKWWVGPGLRLNFNYYNLDYDLEAANVFIGGGGETGVNIHVSPTISLCLGGGIHYNAFGYAAGTDELGSLVWGDGPFYFIQVGALFHTGSDRDAWAYSAGVP